MGKFLRFLLVGGAGFCLDAAVTYALVTQGVGPLAARIPAIACAMSFTWWANRRLTFRSQDVQALQEALRYFMVALAMAAFNYAIYAVLIKTGLAMVFAIVLATGMQAVLSFFLYQKLVFFRVQK
jgi:putative flippase GtrA